ncbi:hypothetical protein GC174_17700 [bacterium]|nr:hypothetical protein [bacterium]
MTEEERSDDLCRFCGLTKDSGSSGSITQYIRTCVCSMGKEGELWNRKLLTDAKIEDSANDFGFLMDDPKDLTR